MKHDRRPTGKRQPDAVAAAPLSPTDDPELRSLLDHMARLLAEEYVSLLRTEAKSDTQTGGEPE